MWNNDTRSSYQIKSIVKAFRLLEEIVTKSEFGVSELSRLLETPKPTVHRLLSTLESLGYVRQDPKTMNYMANIKIFELGAEVLQKLNFVEIAKPVMTSLCEKTSETINLGVLDNVDVVCVHKVESKENLRSDQPIGTKVKAYQAAMGKVILAHLSSKERAQLFSKYGISISTPKSLKTVSAIEEELRKVRERGYAVDNEEGVSGVCCVGAPILDHNAKVIAGLSIAGPAPRIKDKNTEYLAKLVTEATAFISSRLGFRT